MCSSERYSDEELEIFKSLIFKKMEEENKNISCFVETLESCKAELPECFNPVDRSSLFTNIDFLNTQIERSKKLISNLEIALVRVENKTFGICQKTGRLIPRERMSSCLVTSCVRSEKK